MTYTSNLYEVITSTSTTVFQNPATASTDSGTSINVSLASTVLSSTVSQLPRTSRSLQGVSKAVQAPQRDGFVEMGKLWRAWARPRGRKLEKLCHVMAVLYDDNSMEMSHLEDSMMLFRTAQNSTGRVPDQ